jgi:4-hydroxyphenylpyruvate dioxygenase-like putative hemolysin
VLAYLKIVVEDPVPLLNTLAALGLKPATAAMPAKGCHTTIMRAPGAVIYVSAPVTPTGPAQDWLKEHGPGLYEIGVYGGKPGTAETEGGIRIVTVTR